MMSTREKMMALTQVAVDLNRFSDLDMVLERILAEARRFVNADAGSIYAREGDQLRFAYTQNDTLQRRAPAGSKLIYSTFSVPIDQNTISGYVAMTGTVLNIPDVYEIASACPYRFSDRFDRTAGYRTRSVLTVPLVNSERQVLGVLQVINPLASDGSVRAFEAEDERVMEHFGSLATVALERAHLVRGMIMRSIKMAELRDPKETGGHVNRVAGYAVEIYDSYARKKGISRAEVDANRDVLRMSAMLHDVGKVAISDSILKKPGRLTPEEFEVMKTHALSGAALFAAADSRFDRAAFDVTLNHHEKWNGQGYPGHVDPLTGRALPGFEGPDGKPRGKRGEEIPLFGRIVAIADVYDAIRSKRCYKDAMPEAKVLAILGESSGKDFDPELINVFMSSVEAIQAVGARYLDPELPADGSP